MLTGKARVNQTLFVGNLDSRVTEEILFELFLQAGPLIYAIMAKDKKGNPKKFGFVCFKHPESVPYAKALLNGIRLYGKPMKLHFQFGSIHSSPQSSGNGLIANAQDYGTPVTVDHSTLCKTPVTDDPSNQCRTPVAENSLHPAPFFSPINYVNNNYFQQALMYYQEMMNQYFTFQNPPYGWNVQQPLCSSPALPWGNNLPFAAQGNLGSGFPQGTQVWNENSQMYQKMENSYKKRKQLASDSSDDMSGDYGQVKQGKHKAKRRKKQQKQSDRGMDNLQRPMGSLKDDDP